MVARHGLFAAVKMPILINRKDVVTSLDLIGNFRDLLKCIC